MLQSQECNNLHVSAHHLSTGDVSVVMMLSLLMNSERKDILNVKMSL